MGASVSTQVANQTSIVVNKAMTNLVNRSTSTASGVSVSGNKISLSLEGADIKGCNINITQKIKSTQDIKCMAKFTSVSDMKEQLKSALQNQAQQESQQKMQALTLGLGASTNIQNFNQTISNYIETNITNETFNEVNGYLANTNGITVRAKGMTFDCRGSGGKIPAGLTIDQSIVSKQTVSLLTDAVMEGIMERVSDTEADTQGAQKSDQKMDGIQGVISALGLTIMLPLFICMGLVLVIMGPGLIKGMSAKKGKFFFGSRLRKIRFGGGRRW